MHVPFCKCNLTSTCSPALERKGRKFIIKFYGTSLRPFVPRLPIGDRTFKGDVGNGEEKEKGDSFNILPQLYQCHDRSDQDAITLAQ